MAAASTTGGTRQSARAAPDTHAEPQRPGRPDFPISLNTSTLRGHKLPITEVIDIAAEAGYAGIEPWPDELDRYTEAGHSLRDLRQRLDDRGLAVNVLTVDVPADIERMAACGVDGVVTNVPDVALEVLGPRA